jgi:hypothetical protein
MSRSAWSGGVLVMTTNPYLAARESIASSIETLPDPLKDSNAAGFLKIVEQLKQSYIALLELQAIVTKVDVADSAAVQALVGHLRDYADVNTGELNEDRTRCGNIRRTARVMSLCDPAAQPVMTEIQALGSADDQFVAEVEAAALDALNTAETIMQAQLTVDAIAAQADYVARTETAKKQIKAQLVQMNQISTELLDRI